MAIGAFMTVPDYEGQIITYFVFFLLNIYSVIHNKLNRKLVGVGFLILLNDLFLEKRGHIIIFTTIVVLSNFVLLYKRN